MFKKAGNTLGILFLPLLMLTGCGPEKNGSSSGNRQQSPVPGQKQSDFIITEPRRNSYIQPGKTFEVAFEVREGQKTIDSVLYFLENELIPYEAIDSTTARLTMPDLPPGQASLRLKIYSGEDEPVTLTVPIRLTSNRIPDSYTYRVVNTYPHDKSAFTQGLEYHEGFLFEGTGNYGESSLRKVDLQTGEILKFRNLSSDLFGEGITRINNKIYQITYRAQVGFVYDENNFELLRKIYYQIREGWGLTNNGEHILMSDGSNVIYYMDTTYFSVVKKVEVYDHEGEVDQLNELELINGILYANRYTTNEIVMIEPETGRLLGRIDMSGILDPADRHPSIDFFNGIAYDKENDRIFVTGKYWPKLYEVEFMKVGS